ncbi:gas vesicle protein [Alphaproteobacteria bacterium GH1-50]|uniref:Gas vesicle protein n=1 Tax=Kangsaoukella pontilimi TaxID=2691042 RepID=A0A7C9MJP6_9RHOB|nr:gas vesicle protein [Kangsaoukella pontilimi]MXQ07935.1 gas vesicle protein [Kangsaoukella pontilimi]
MAERRPLDMVFATPEDALSARDERLVDLVDGLLDHGVVLHGEVWLTVAGIDLVYLGLSAVLTTADKIQAGPGAA